MIRKRFKSSQRLIQTEQGLSIIEVMAAATILAIIAVGAASFVPTAFRANRDSRDLTVSTQIMNNIMEQLNTIDFQNVSPYPFTTEPIYTTSNQVAVIDTTNLNAGSPITVCLKRASGSSTCETGQTMQFPLKWPRQESGSIKKLNQAFYRVDLVVYKGKPAHLAYLPAEITERFAMASLPEFAFEKGLLSLSELLIPPAYAATCSANISPGTTVEAGTQVNFTGVSDYGSPKNYITYTNTSASPASTTIGAAATYSYTWNSPGSYTVSLAATKNNGGSATACSPGSYTINVTSLAGTINVFPGISTFVGVPLSFSLTGCSSCTAGNTTWEMTGCTPAIANGLTAVCYYPAIGSYTVRARKSGALIDSKTITVGNSTVNITAPAANSTVSVGQNVGFTATCSNCGSSPVYEWNFGDASPALTGQSVSHSYTSTGAMTATVTLKDGSVNPAVTIGNSSVGLTVISGTSASLSVSPPSGVAGNVSSASTTEFTFQTASNGFSGSPNNPSNAPVTYNIWFGDGNTTSQAADLVLVDSNPADSAFPSTTHKYTDCGLYTATVKAEVGSTNATGTANVNLSASALISSTANTIEAGQSITFTGSTEGNGTGTFPFQWSFPDDSSTATGTTVSHAFNTPGSYTVSLNVNGGCNPTGTKLITVQADANSIAANQSYMKKVIVKVSPWSVTPPNPQDILSSAVLLKANND